MPYLATLIGSLFAGLVTWLGKYLTRRMALTAAVIVILFGMITTFWTAINLMIGGISLHTPQYLNQALSMVMPDNVPTLISILITARVARWAYEWNVKILQWRLF